MKKIIILMLIMMLVMPSVMTLEDLGTFQQNECVRIAQTCASCSYVNISSITRTSSNDTLANNVEMNDFGDGEWFYQFCDTAYTGRYDVRGKGDLDGTDTSFATYFIITTTGADTPESSSVILASIFIIIFGIACFFLVLAFKLQTNGTKLFFFLASFVFLIGSLGTAMIVGFDSNLSSGITSITTTMLYALGLILFLILAFVLIKQITSALDMMREKKGYEPDF